MDLGFNKICKHTNEANTLELYNPTKVSSSPHAKESATRNCGLDDPMGIPSMTQALKEESWVLRANLNGDQDEVEEQPLMRTRLKEETPVGQTVYALSPLINLRERRIEQARIKNQKSKARREFLDSKCMAL